MLSTNKLICATDTPNNAGNMRFITPTTPGSRKPILNLGSNPTFFKKGICMKNCPKPPKITPHANVVIGEEECGAHHNATAIKLTFNNTGVNASAANKPHVFKIAPANAVNTINNKYGNMICNNCCVNA